MAELDLKVDGMDCGGCEESIKKSVSRLEGVQSVSADHDSGRVQVAFTGEPGEQAIRAAIEDAGFEVVGTGA